MKPGKIEIFYVLAVLLPILILAGCGGGGGHSSSTSTPTQMISGTAAAGWPLTGTVTIKDSKGATNSTTSDVAGAYSINVTGMTAPFMLMASGSIAGVSTQLYSGATQADIGGTINITPLTDLIIANVAGEIAANYYGSGNFSSLTANNLNTQDVKLQAELSPISLGISGFPVSTSDLLRTVSFLTNNTGLDALIDLVTVADNAATNSATITNITNQQTVTVEFATQTYSSNANFATPATTTTASVSAITSITSFFSSFFTNLTASIATNQTLATDQSLLNLFDQSLFLNNGQELTAFLTALDSTTNTGLTLNGLSILALDPVGGTATVNFTTNAGFATQTQTMKFILVNGSWLAEGNLN